MFRGKRFKCLICVVMALLLVCISQCTNYAASGNGHSSSSIPTSSITATSFIASMNTGWNLGNSLDSYYGKPTGDANLSMETIWKNPKVTKELIDYVRSLGFNTIRVPVSWYYHSYKDANGQYHVHPDWLARVKEVVNYCVANDMYVIMNSHHDNPIFYVGANAEKFANVCNRATTIWTDIANYFNDVDGHLIFEAFNETDNVMSGRTFSTTAANQMNQLNQVFVNAVRSTGGNNAQRLLIIPTLFHNSADDVLNSFVLPTDVVPGKLLTAVHFYSQVLDQYLDPEFARLQNFATRVGAPMVITEWGSTTKYAPAEFRPVHAANYVARANAHGIKCVYWDNGYEYAIIYRKNLTCNGAMVNAMLNPAPYTSAEGSALDNWTTSCLYMGMDESNGALKEWESWGGLVLNQDGNGLVNIPAGATSMSLQLTKSGNMAKQAFHFVYFYNEGYGLVSYVNTHFGFADKVIAIPAGATRVRICIYNAFDPTTKESYDAALANGTLKPVVKFY